MEERQMETDLQTTKLYDVPKPLQVVVLAKLSEYWSHFSFHIMHAPWWTVDLCTNLGGLLISVRVCPYG